MIIEELITLAKMMYKEKAIDKMKKGQVLFGGQRIKSIAQLANETTYFFQVVSSDNLASDELIMIVRAVERSYAIFARTAFSLIPAVEVDSFNASTVKDYLSMFHTNIGLNSNISIKTSLFETSNVDNFNTAILNEATLNTKSPSINISPLDAFGDKGRMTFASDASSVKGYMSTLGKMNPAKIMSDVDWKKANDLLPTVINVPIKFVSVSKEKHFEHVVEVQVNIKATMHKASTDVLVQDLANTVANKKGFLNFVKYISGEQKSTADFMFGISQIKREILDKKGNPWLNAFRRRKRLADLAWNTLSNNFKPTGTICITMNEVELLKLKYNIDIFKEAEKIMREYYLLGFLIADQTNEVLHVMYDSQPGFQEYPYRTLEREAASQDRTIKDMVKAMGAFK